MGNQLLSSKVVINEEEPRIRSITGVPTAVLGLVGIAERGPIGERKLVTSFDEFVRYFGGDVLNSEMIHSARGFFEEGGQFLYVVRTVHYTDVATPSSKTSAKGNLTIQTASGAPAAATVLGTVVGPWDLEPGDDLDISIDGGGALTATFSATAASRENGVDEVFVLADGQTLTVSIDGGSVQTVTFLTTEFADITNATAEEVAAVINAKMTGGSATVTSLGKRVTIASDKRGTGSSVDVTGGTANTALQFTTGSIAGTGNVANIDSVQFAEAQSVIQGAVAGTTVTADSGRLRISTTATGASHSVQVEAGSTADDDFGLDNAVHAGTDGGAVDTLKVEGKYDGSYVNDYKIRILTATSGTASEFNLQVEDGGVAVEVWPNLTMDDTKTNFVETVLNHVDTGSTYVTATDLDASAPLEGRPADGLHGPMTGGDDGLTGLVDADFIGSSVGKTGMRALDLAQDLTMLGIPGRATAAVQTAMLSYCEITRDRAVLAILDSPLGSTATGIVTYVETTAALLESSEQGALYWPWVKVVNPNAMVYGDDPSLVVSPVGIIAGVAARNDAKEEGGVYQPPAGIEYGKMRSVVGLETEEVLDEEKRDLVFPKRINPLTAFSGSGGYFIDGARTLKSGGNFPTVGERRGVSYIEQSIKAGIQFARHRNNDKALRMACDRTVTAFLLLQMKNKAFRSMVPREAFFVDFGEGLNTVAQQFAGKLLARIGLATQKPAEFIILNFAQDTRALEQELLKAQQ